MARHQAKPFSDCGISARVQVVGVAPRGQLSFATRFDPSGNAS